MVIQVGIVMNTQKLPVVYALKPSLRVCSKTAVVSSEILHLGYTNNVIKQLGTN